MRVDETTVIKAFDLARAFGMKHSAELKVLGTEPEDFAQDIIVNLLHRTADVEFDATKTKGLDLFVFSNCRRYLIDLKRAKYQAKTRKDLSFVSTDMPVGEDGDDTFGDLFLESDPDLQMALMEMIDSLPEDQISPNYRLTFRSLFLKSIDMEPEEIAKEVGISASRVQQLQKQMIRDHLGGAPSKRARKPVTVNIENLLD